MATRFLIDGPDRAKHTILLAHGAGGPMDSPAMTAAARTLAASGFRVARFEFAYMARRRSSAGRKPPPRAETLCPEYFAAIDALGAKRPLIIGGKSMGGRIASMIADDLHAAGRIMGLLCLGYPFHPIGKPEQLRGTRDPFGTREEVSTYALSKSIEILWLEDGDHDLKPRQRISGFSVVDHLRTVGETAAAWARRIAG